MDNSLVIFFKVLLIIAIIVLIYIIGSMIQQTQTIQSGFNPLVQQSCISNIIAIENMNINSSLKEAAINAIENSLFCQNLTENNTTYNG